MRPALRSVAVAAALVLQGTAGRAEDRGQLIACQALVERATARDAGGAPNDPELIRCRQIIKEWALRDARMSVDERGRPLR
jgi:hypothetical protein